MSQNPEGSVVIELPSQKQSNSISNLAKKKSTVVNPHDYTWKKIVSLDGHNPNYTISVLMTMSFALVILFFERGFLVGRGETFYSDASTAGLKIGRSVCLLFFAVLNGVFAFLLLLLNVKDFKDMKILKVKIIVFFSFMGFAISNGLAIWLTYESRDIYEWRVDEGKYHGFHFTHYYLLAIFWISLIVTDWMYIRLIYSPFFEEEKGWKSLQRNIEKLQKIRKRERGELTITEIIKYELTKHLTLAFNSFNKSIYKTFKFIDELPGKIHKSQKNRVARLNGFSKNVSDFFTSEMRSILKSIIIKFIYSILKFISYVFSKLYDILTKPFINPMNELINASPEELGLWSRVKRRFALLIYQISKRIRTFKPSVQKSVNEFWEDIREDDRYKHSAWIKAAVLVSALLLIYFGLRIQGSFTNYMNDIYRPLSDCIIHYSGVSNFFLRFIGYAPPNTLNNTTIIEDAITDTTNPDTDISNFGSICAIPDDTNNTGLDFDITALDSTSDTTIGTYETLSNSNSPYLSFIGDVGLRIEEDRTEDKLHDCKSRVTDSETCAMLALVNNAEDTLQGQSGNVKPSDIFFESSSGKVIYVMDIFLRNLYYTSWIGFIFGVFVGFYSLLYILAQYKWVTLRIRKGDFNSIAQGSGRKERKDLDRKVTNLQLNQWVKNFSHYPMSSSIFFFGLLVSTAILQMVLFGGLVASLFAIIAFIFDSKVYEILKPVMSLLFAFLITWLVNGPIATMVIGEGMLITRYIVLHEILFFLYLLVFTSVHLVVGVFISFFRFIWVLLTALGTLTCLDRNIFIIWKKRDLAHKSFIALIFMHHAFYMNSSPEEAKENWNKLLSFVNNRKSYDSSSDDDSDDEDSEEVKEVLRKLTEADNTIIYNVHNKQIQNTMKNNKISPGDVGAPQPRTNTDMHLKSIGEDIEYLQVKKDFYTTEPKVRFEDKKDHSHGHGKKSSSHVHKDDKHITSGSNMSTSEIINDEDNITDSQREKLEAKLKSLKPSQKSSDDHS